jgi:hypothetical protein
LKTKGLINNRPYIDLFVSIYFVIHFVRATLCCYLSV